MRFLIKVALWLSIVVLLLPGDPASRGDSDRSQVGPIEALGAAQAAVEDASGFCERQPEACEVGSQAFQSFGEKAQHGAKLLYEFLSARFAGKSDVAPRSTGSIKNERRPGQHTLTPEDLAPGWNGPGLRPTPMPPRRPA
jgi:hypothetical protein